MLLLFDHNMGGAWVEPVRQLIMILTVHTANHRSMMYFTEFSDKNYCNQFLATISTPRCSQSLKQLGQSVTVAMMQVRYILRMMMLYT